MRSPLLLSDIELGGLWEKRTLPREGRKRRGGSTPDLPASHQYVQTDVPLAGLGTLGQIIYSQILQTWKCLPFPGTVTTHTFASPPCPKPAVHRNASFPPPRTKEGTNVSSAHSSKEKEKLIHFQECGKSREHLAELQHGVTPPLSMRPCASRPKE